MDMRKPIEMEEIRGPSGSTNAFYFRFTRETPVRSLQPDDSRFVFIEVDADGQLVGVLSYEPSNMLVVESLDSELVEQDGQPVGVGARNVYSLHPYGDLPDTREVQLQTLQPAHG